MNEITQAESGERETHEGVISRIDDGVAWGRFTDDFTFDLPVDDFHAVGDKVRFSENEDPDEIGSSHTFIVMGAAKATVLWCDISDNGFEVVKKVVLSKNEAQ